MKSLSETVTSFQELPQQPYFWLLVIAFTALFTFFIYKKSKKQIIPLTRSESGGVSVTQKAIKALIKKTCEASENVSLQEIKLKFKKGLLFTSLKIKLNGNDSIEEACSALQSKLSRVLHKNLGDNNIGAINLITTGFGPSALTAPAETDDQSTQEEESEPSYTYYEPVPDELNDPFLEEEDPYKN